MLLRTQQRELTDLSALIETMPGTIMAQVEHLLQKHQEQERILQFLIAVVSDKRFTCKPRAVEIHVSMLSRVP